MGVFSGIGKKLGQYLFEFLAIITIFVIGLVLTIYATQAHSQCKQALNGKLGEIPDADKDNYEGAKHNLQQIVWIGWTIVSLSIVFLVVLIIVAVVGAPAEVAGEGALLGEEAITAGATEVESLFSRGAKLAYEYGGKIKDLGTKINTLTKSKKNGLYFHSFFGGWITTGIFFIMLATIFFLGIYAAMASVKLSNTTDKFGQGKAQVAAILGIVPFSIFIVWLFTDSIYRWIVSSKLEKVEEEQKEVKEEAKQEAKAEKEKERKEKEESKNNQQILSSVISNISQTNSTRGGNLSTQLANTAKSGVSDFISSSQGQQLIKNAGSSILSALTS